MSNGTTSTGPWRAPVLPGDLWSADPTLEGIFAGVPEKIYHASPGLSGTSCKTLGRGPAYYAASLDKKAKEAGEKPDPKRQKALDFGKLAHAIVLEGIAPEDIEAHGFAIKPEGHNGATTAGKAFVAENRGKVLVDADDIEDAVAMGEAIKKHAWANRLMSRPGRTELSVRVRHPVHGILLRGRFDRVLDVGTVLTDYKTTTDASPEEFAKSVYDFGYLLQAGDYLNLAKWSGLEDLKDWAWVVQEKAAPFACAVYTFGPSHERWDEVQYALDLIYKRAARLEKSGDYSATLLPQEPCKVILPHWAKSVADGLNLEGEEEGEAA